MDNLKKPWVSILLIIMAIGGTALGSYAYFTATRTAETNTFTAGTLDLNVTGDNIANKPFVITNMGENANISGSQDWTITNTGSLPGRLLVRVTNLDNQENGCNDQETAVETTCANDTVGELGGVITLNVAMDGVDQVSSTLTNADLLVIGDQWNDTVLPVIMQPGDSHVITMHWETNENAYGNEIQSDSLTFDTVFQLIQAIDGPSPANRGITNTFGNL
ncbi:hypothetical protein COV58_02540 [Candidatus Roizmanbacteria bacterium CG11_big_fil_rev_8_21_14_0_20_36_8]|uniref:Uncharacterized protein n=2 Tax=Candidatus Roizmaniibacteriota TaxID=1752723 RepID=A0A2M6IU63_9BACT|nr:MAG: hypothetical protein COV58_02540 [Candidatus Roizmanbacteria bacterium CG11_big_fil_rev_8_21_14_0_20_36_8]PIZ65393.1 MAG: hypothetical protein COY14_02455 [Candidatus Roizmanbacteria bacterium CG_4_10_14_0_2_um_filter_36_9]